LVVINRLLRYAQPTQRALGFHCHFFDVANIIEDEQFIFISFIECDTTRELNLYWFFDKGMAHYANLHGSMRLKKNNLKTFQASNALKHSCNEHTNTTKKDNAIGKAIRYTINQSESLSAL